MIISRAWAMPSPATFSIPPISGLLDRWLSDCVVVIDPFSGNSLRGTLRNDLRHGAEATEWLRTLDVQADAVLFDPPYSPRQISEAYKSIGLEVGMRETQNGRLYKAVKDELHRLLKPDGIAICCGWNSAGFGKVRGYEFEEILLVAHGGAHNDTIVTVERRSG
jgi:Predicted DNA modification methylase